MGTSTHKTVCRLSPVSSSRDIMPVAILEDTSRCEYVIKALDKHADGER
jgi:hypothetical protein